MDGETNVEFIPMVTADHSVNDVEVICTSWVRKEWVDRTGRKRFSDRWAAVTGFIFHRPEIIKEAEELAEWFRQHPNAPSEYPKERKSKFYEEGLKLFLARRAPEPSRSY